MQRIDVHHHILPRPWMDEVHAIGAPSRGWVPELVNWTPERSLEQMDRFEIATAIVTQGLPGVWFGDVQQARRLARASNEYAADMARRFPGRFGFFATLPLPDVEGSLAEAAYALDELKADGVWMLTSYDNVWPGDARFAPLFDELNRRKAVTYFHPTVPACCTGIMPDVPAAAVEYIFDTTRAVTNLLYTGTFTRCPDIRYIFSHAGGAVPMIAARLALIARGRPQVTERLPDGVQHELEKLYFEIATSVSPPTFSALLAFSPIQRILFGTDYPFVPDMAQTTAGLETAGLDPVELQAINHRNAARLFPDRVTAWQP
jgi:predicted TIM-barrel fold metal-dependent hydrolase